MTEWRKSSFSDVNTDCVEVARTSDRVRVRDSKNPTTPSLAVPTGEWRAFIASLN